MALLPRVQGPDLTLDAHSFCCLAIGVQGVFITSNQANFLEAVRTSTFVLLRQNMHPSLSDQCLICFQRQGFDLLIISKEYPLASKVTAVQPAHA